MSFIGTFGMFTTVRMGIYTSQQGLNLTGNNIANINTVGYTRQTLDLKSMNAAGVDRYTDSNTRIGSGAYVTGISQMRDPYLDIRYRTEAASVGYMDTKLSNLNDLAAILDEVGDGDDENGIISAQLSDILSALENLTEYTGQGEFDTQVRSSAASLVALFNSYANKLDQVELNAVDRFKQDVKAVNELLQNIQSLTDQIRTGDIHGTPGLEMRDERNRLIDELSQYIKIDVRYEMETIAPSVEVEKLRIRLADHYNPPIYLVDGIYAVQLQQDETMPAINPTYDSTALPYLDDNDTPTDDVAFQNNPNPLACPYLQLDLNPDPTHPYLDEGGNPVSDPSEAKSTPVKELAQATQIPNTNYNITLSSMKDTAGNVKFTYDPNQIFGAVDVAPNAPSSVTINGKLYDIAEGLAGVAASKNGRYSWLSYPNPDGTQNEFTIKMVGNDPDNPQYTVSMAVRQNSVEIPLGDNDLYGSLQAAREFLTEAGEFATTGYINQVDPNGATKRGVRYYKHALDLLANKFAESMNNANNDYLYTHDPVNDKYYYVDENGDLIKDDNGNAIEKMSYEALVSKYPTEEQREQLGLVKADNSGNLFSTRGDNNDGEGITASNISISADWASGAVQIVNSYAVVPGTNKVGTTDNTNILHMVTLMNKDLKYHPNEIVDDAKKDSIFTGSFGEMLGNINAVLGNDQSSTKIMLDNYYEAAVELDTSRDAVSSVDLNDETVNMIQYQKSYSAACRLMTAMDEILDKLINGTGVAGR